MDTVLRKMSNLTSPKRVSNNCIFTPRLTSTFITSVILLWCMATCTYAFPDRFSANLPDFKVIPSSVFDNPCGGTVPGGPRIRHNQQNIKRVLGFQLQKTLNDFKHLNNTRISQVYNPSMYIVTAVPPVVHTRVTKKVTIQNMVAKLDQNILSYAKAFDKLSNLVVSTEAASGPKILKKRSVILKTLKQNLQSLRCEFKTLLYESGAPSLIPTANPIIPDIGKWPKNPDLSQMFQLDYTTFVHYKKFLEEWMKALKSLGKKKKMRPTTARAGKAGESLKPKRRMPKGRAVGAKLSSKASGMKSRN